MFVPLVEPVWKGFGIRIPITEKTVQKMMNKHLSKHPIFMDIVVSFEADYLRLSGKCCGVKITLEMVPLLANNGIIYIWIRNVKPVNWNWLLGKLVNRVPFMELQNRLLTIDLHQIKVTRGLPIGLWRTFEIKQNRLWIGI